MQSFLFLVPSWRFISKRKPYDKKLEVMESCFANFGSMGIGLRSILSQKTVKKVKNKMTKIGPKFMFLGAFWSKKWWKRLQKNPVKPLWPNGFLLGDLGGKRVHEESFVEKNVGKIVILGGFGHKIPKKK